VANPIKPKRSYTTTNTPSLTSGEIGINATDGKIWIGNAAGNANVLVSSLSLSDHTGTLAVASGGTGATSANAAANAILPSQTSNSGKYLTTNGTDTSWGTVSSGTTLPTGALMPYAGASAPTGYLLCDGSSVSSSTYLALHAVISNTYGGSAYTGAGALFFSLPDLRGRLPMGAGTGTGLNASGTGAPSGTAQTARTRGQWGGEETNLLSTTEMPSHSHNGATGNAGSHSHTQGSYPGFVYVGSGGNSAVSSGTNWIGSTGYTLTNTVANHTHTIDAQGGGGRHNNVPPFVVLNYIIKT